MVLEESRVTVASDRYQGRPVKMLREEKTDDDQSIEHCQQPI